MMKNTYKIWGIGILMGLMSCSEQEIVEVQQQGRQITATAVTSGTSPVFSRLAFEDKKDGEGGVGVNWGDGDKFDVIGTSASAEMAISTGQGAKTAQFTGVLTGTLEEGESVNAYYPASAYDDANSRFNVDFRTITQDCTAGNEMNHLSATYLMTGSGTHREGDINVSFVNGTKVAMLRFDLTLPQQTASGLTIDELQIVCEDLKTVGTLSSDGETFTPNVVKESHRQKVILTNLSASTEGDTQFSVYVNVLPVTITGTMRLKVMLSDEMVYWCDVDLTNVTLQANNRYYLVRAFLEEQKVGVDYSWYTENKNAAEFEISTEAQLRALAKIVNGKAASGVGSNVFNNKTIKLMNNIDLKVDWVPIGYRTGTGSYAVFCGTFDGNNKTISGIYCYDDLLFTDSNVAGFFGATKRATIKDLTVKGRVKSAETYIGGLIGCNRNDNDIQSVIQNCRNEIDVTSTQSSTYVGGIVGWARNALIINCSNVGKIESLKTSNVVMGGIIGFTDRGASIINCSNTARIECLNTSSGDIGGIIGKFNTSSTSIVMACFNEGTIGTLDLSDIYIGGIAGRYATDSSTGGAGYVVANYNLANPLVDGDIEHRKVAGLTADNFIKTASASYKVYLDIYGSYSLYAPLYQASAIKSDELYCDESSVVLSESDKNTQANADLLNAGIYKWNTNTGTVCGGKAVEGVNNDTEDIRYCNYHFEPGDTHLVLKDGAPSAPANSGTEGEQ